MSTWAGRAVQAQERRGEGEDAERLREDQGSSEERQQGQRGKEAGDQKSQQETHPVEARTVQNQSHQ